MSDSCNFLQGVCTLQSLLDGYLTSGDFELDGLKEQIAEVGGIKFIPYDAQPDETAKVLVTMRRGDIILSPQNNMGSDINTVAYRPSLTVVIKISTQSYRLTEKLGQEILQFLAIMSAEIKKANLTIGGLQLSPTANLPDSSPNYFACTITASCGIPLTMWKIANSSDILTSVKINTTFN